MTNKEITDKINMIKENYQNGNCTGDDMCELLSDLCCEIEELESQYSMIWRIRIQLDKGQRTSREDLKYINKVNRELTF